MKEVHIHNATRIDSLVGFGADLIFSEWGVCWVKGNLSCCHLLRVRADVFPLSFHSLITCGSVKLCSLWPHDMIKL